jgi:hypothetical protein
MHIDMPVLPNPRTPTPAIEDPQNTISLFPTPLQVLQQQLGEQKTHSSGSSAPAAVPAPVFPNQDATAVQVSISPLPTSSYLAHVSIEFYSLRYQRIFDGFLLFYYV